MSPSTAGACHSRMDEISNDSQDAARTTSTTPVVPIGGTGVITRGDDPSVAAPPDIIAQYEDHDGLSLRAVSLRGPGHRAWGEPRQDSYAVVRTPDWLVAIVADGIGSMQWSHVGSSTAAQAVAEAVAQGADPEALPMLLVAADSACLAASVALGVDPELLFTTLTVAAVSTRADDDGSRVVTVHEVGDSPVLVLDTAEQSWRIHTAAHKLGSAPVDAVVPHRHEKAVSYGLRLTGHEALVVASDGLLEHLGTGTGAYANALATLWSPGPRPLINYVADLSTNFDVDCRDDDRTVVTVWNEHISFAPADVSDEVVEDDGDETSESVAVGRA